MLFSSLLFLFWFLPLTLAAYYATLLPPLAGLGSVSLWRRAGNLVLLLASLLFYGWGEIGLLWVMIVAILTSFVGGLGVAAARDAARAEGKDPTGRGKIWLWGTTIVSLGMLAFFKYANFGLQNYNWIVEVLGQPDAAVKDALQIALPLGISFYTFQALSYTIDVYRGEVHATKNIIDFACYVTMFPQLVAGPIVRYVDVARELVSRTHRPEDVADGAMRFAMGLAKKVLIANVVAVPADAIFEMPSNSLSMSAAWVGVVCYTLQIYFDFSAYSDMAIGLGRMLGFRFGENFNYPYIARSNQEFWRRWHISLSTWFRDYVYIPLGGNRGSGLVVYRNLMIVFVLCGLWHGASWNFVAWGVYHGLFLMIERIGLAGALARCPVFLQHSYLLAVALVGWVLFRVASLEQAGAYLSAMVGKAPGSSVPVHLLDPRLIVTVIIGAVLAVPVVPWTSRWWRSKAETGGWIGFFWTTTRSIGRPIWIAVLLLVSAAVLTSGSHNPFIYFRF
jgi:alginate O-acetyltransferase complex protein AlgI